MISGEGGNVALYTTSEGVILVDDMFDRNHDDILEQIKTVTDKPLSVRHQHPPARRGRPIRTRKCKSWMEQIYARLCSG